MFGKLYKMVEQGDKGVFHVMKLANGSRMITTGIIGKKEREEANRVCQKTAHVTIFHLSMIQNTWL